MYPFSSKLPHHLSCSRKVHETVIYCNLFLINKQQQQQKNILSKGTEAKTFHCSCGIRKGLSSWWYLSLGCTIALLGLPQASLKTQVITFYFCPTKLNLPATYLRSLPSVLIRSNGKLRVPTPHPPPTLLTPCQKSKIFYIHWPSVTFQILKNYWYMVALQCCVSFCYTAKYRLYIYIYISSPRFQISVSNRGRKSSFIHTLKIFQNLNKVTDGFTGLA